MSLQRLEFGPALYGARGAAYRIDSTAWLGVETKNPAFAGLLFTSIELRA